MTERVPLGEGSYRLFKQGGGKTAYAEVHVALEPQSGERDVVLSIAGTDAESADPDLDAEWFEAAIAGCRHALSLLGDPQTVLGQRIVVTRLLINLVDTTADAVWAAAAKATAEALGAAERLRVVFRDRWTVELSE